MHDEKTEHKGYTLPHRENQLNVDVDRLREAISAIDGDIHALEENTNKEIKSLKSEVGAVGTYVGTGLVVLRCDEADLFTIVGDVRGVLKEGDKIKVNSKVATITSAEHADDEAETRCTLDAGILEEGDVSHEIAVCREYVTIPETPQATASEAGIVKLAAIPSDD